LNCKNYFTKLTLSKNLIHFSNLLKSKAMKNLYLYFTAIFFLVISHHAKSQIVYSNDFENWTNSLPDGWGQNGTNIHPDSIVEYTSDPFSGNKSMRINFSGPNGSLVSVFSDSIYLGNGTYTISYYFKSNRSGRMTVSSGVSDGSSMFQTSDSVWAYNQYSFSKYSNSDSAAINLTSIISANTNIAHYIIVDNLVIRKMSDLVDLNNIFALINPNGSLFQDPITSLPNFEAPKGSGKNSMYILTPWITGFNNIDSALHFSGYYYHNYYMGMNKFGPVSDTVNDLFRNNYLRVWKVNKSEIDFHIANYNNPNYSMPEAIKNWPGNGNTQNGEPYGLAPYENAGGSMYYEPQLGDYPKIRGDQAIFFLYNDFHNLYDSIRPSLGLETHGMAYVFDAPNDSALNNTLFLNYQIINRSINDYHNVRFGIFGDIDIGDYNDDYTGCDTSLNMFYGYNALDSDGYFGEPQYYGNPPPAQGVQFLNATMDNFINFSKGSGLIDGNPYDNFVFNHYLTGRWRNGEAMGTGGFGFHSGGADTTIATRYLYPGVPEQGIGWIADSSGFSSDINGVMSHGPFDLTAGEKVCFDIALPFAWDRNGTRLTSLALLRQRAAAIKTFYDAQNFDCDLTATSNQQTFLKKQEAKLYPNPNNGQFFLESDVFGNQTELEIYSVLGKLIHREKITSPVSNIAIAESKGIYIYLLKNQSEILKTGKLIVE
jgi:hypothetical protein